MTQEINLGQVGQIARGVSDIGQATEWFQKVVGLPLLYTFGDLAFLDCDGVRLFLTELDDGVSAGNSIIYFKVDDINAAYELLKSRGAEFMGEPHMIFRHPDGVEEWMAFFKDMDGSPLAIMSQVKS